MVRIVDDRVTDPLEGGNGSLDRDGVVGVAPGPGSIGVEAGEGCGDDVVPLQGMRAKEVKTQRDVGPWLQVSSRSIEAEQD